MLASFLAVASVLAFSATLASAQTPSTTVEQAKELSSQTGRPIFGMAGRQSCPACVRLLNRLESDPSLAKFSRYFIPLKIDTTSDQWGEWNRQYPVNSRYIPRLYIIRADGEAIFAAAGVGADSDLEKLLTRALSQSGRAWTGPQAERLQQAVKDAEAASQQKDFLGVAHALAPLQEFDTLGNLGSYAEPAVRADTLFEELEQKLGDMAQEAATAVESGEASLEEMIKLAEADAAYALFAQAKNKAAQRVRDARREPALAETLQQAEALVKARGLARSGRARAKARASDAYTAVIRRFPDSRVAQMARDELEQVDPGAAVQPEREEPGANATTGGTEYRQWTSRSGRFTTRAKFVQQSSGKIQLERPDGEKIVVDITRLSDEDQDYLRRR